MTIFHPSLYWGGRSGRGGRSGTGQISTFRTVRWSVVRPGSTRLIFDPSPKSRTKKIIILGTGKKLKGDQLSRQFLGQRRDNQLRDGDRSDVDLSNVILSVFKARSRRFDIRPVPKRGACPQKGGLPKREPSAGQRMLRLCGN